MLRFAALKKAKEFKITEQVQIVSKISKSFMISGVQYRRSTLFT